MNLDSRQCDGLPLSASTWSVILFYSSKILCDRVLWGRGGVVGIGGVAAGLKRHEYPVSRNPKGKTLVIEPLPNTILKISTSSTSSLVLVCTSSILTFLPLEHHQSTTVLIIMTITREQIDKGFVWHPVEPCKMRHRSWTSVTVL